MGITSANVKIAEELVAHKQPSAAQRLARDLIPTVMRHADSCVLAFSVTWKAGIILKGGVEGGKFGRHIYGARHWAKNDF